MAAKVKKKKKKKSTLTKSACLQPKLVPLPLPCAACPERRAALRSGSATPAGRALPGAEEMRHRYPQHLHLEPGPVTHHERERGRKKPSREKTGSTQSGESRLAGSAESGRAAGPAAPPARSAAAGPPRERGEAAEPKCPGPASLPLPGAAPGKQQANPGPAELSRWGKGDERRKKNKKGKEAVLTLLPPSSDHALQPTATAAPRARVTTRHLQRSCYRH